MKITLYQIVARVAYNGLWRDVPTFYLRSDMQGILTREHAEKIARDVLNPLNVGSFSATILVSEPVTFEEDDSI
jgi:hypothetical protein